MRGPRAISGRGANVWQHWNDEQLGCTSIMHTSWMPPQEIQQRGLGSLIVNPPLNAVQEGVVKARPTVHVEQGPRHLAAHPSPASTNSSQHQLYIYIYTCTVQTSNFTGIGGAGRARTGRHTQNADRGRATPHSGTNPVNPHTGQNRGQDTGDFLIGWEQGIGIRNTY